MSSSILQSGFPAFSGHFPAPGCQYPWESCNHLHSSMLGPQMVLDSETPKLLQSLHPGLISGKHLGNVWKRAVHTP